jgi:predicted alpha/beta hydrolase family esterase
MNSDLKRFRILLVPGLHDSGPGHWQTRWEQHNPGFERVEQLDWDRPDIVAWSRQIGNMLRRSARPAIIVAHSFGCLATVHRSILGAPNLHGALLVAPADPAKFDLSKLLAHTLAPLATTVVASENDPWMNAGRARRWASQWQSMFISAGPLGHINADSGIGDWPYGIDQLELLARRIPAPIGCGCGSGTGDPAPSVDRRA